MTDDADAGGTGRAPADAPRELTPAASLEEKLAGIAEEMGWTLTSEQIAYTVRHVRGTPRLDAEQAGRVRSLLGGWTPSTVGGAE